MVGVDPRAVISLDAHLAYLRAFTKARGGEIVDGEGWSIFANPIPLPFLVNAVVRTDPAATPVVVVEAALRFFGDRGFELVCLEGRDDDLRQQAEMAGLRTGSPDPLQYLDRRPSRSPIDGSLVEIRVVTDPDGVRDIAAINQDATAVFGFPDEVFASIFAVPATVLVAEIYAVVAYERGAPVATAQVFHHDGYAYVGWVAVMRSAMRRGLGWLVTAEVVNQGIARGARAAVLMASPMGAPLYRRMGFVDVGALVNAHFRPAGR
jgi:ribosomal protein S18 acetylase RimI-like enzyme